MKFQALRHMDPRKIIYDLFSHIKSLATFENIRYRFILSFWQNRTMVKNALDGRILIPKDTIQKFRSKNIEIRTH